MTDIGSGNSTRTSRVIGASPETLYHACVDREALTAWLTPGDMTATVHHFDARVGGGYQMSLLYPTSDERSVGKTSNREDRYTARFVELTPFTRIVEAITFDTADPTFGGEMTMTITFEEQDGGTEVTFVFENLPAGIRPADNDAGTRSSLEKLTRYVERST